MEAVRNSETSVYSSKTTQRYIPEGSNLYTHHCENLKSHIPYSLFYSLCEKPVNLNTAGDDGSVPHIAGQLNNDLYAVPVKRRLPQQQSSVSPNGSTSPKHSVVSPGTGDQNIGLENLPPGWEKHEGNRRL
jgi:hypothetical protein